MIEIKSPATTDYNCVAFIFNDDKNNWWPEEDFHWPESPPSLFPTVDTLIEFFTSQGYIQCNRDSSLEDGFHKVAIFAKNWNTPTHVAKQMPNGKWASKLGTLVDIEHNLQNDLIDDVCLASYGPVQAIMKKRL